MISGREKREIFSSFNRSREAPQQVSMQLNSGCRIMGYAHAVLPSAAGKQYKFHKYIIYALRDECRDKEIFNDWSCER